MNNNSLTIISQVTIGDSSKKKNILEIQGIDEDHIFVSLEKYGICKVRVNRDLQFYLQNLYLEGIDARSFTEIMSNKIISDD